MTVTVGLQNGLEGSEPVCSLPCDISGDGGVCEHVVLAMWPRYWCVIRVADDEMVLVRTFRCSPRFTILMYCVITVLSLQVEVHMNNSTTITDGNKNAHFENRFGVETLQP